MPRQIDQDVVEASTDAILAELQAVTHAEDAAHGSGDLGVQALGVRNDGLATTLTDADGDYSPVATDEKGAAYGTSQIHGEFYLTPGVYHKVTVGSSFVDPNYIGLHVAPLPGSQFETIPFGVANGEVSSEPRLGVISGTSLTGTYQDLTPAIETSFEFHRAYLMNTCDAAIYVSLDGGANDHFLLEPYDSVYFTVSEGGLYFTLWNSGSFASYLPHFMVKHAGVAPTSGRLKVTAFALFYV